ncbi:type II toxin-antitoxin system RelE/ParE family toxin [Paraburkholderia bannensis]|uniref:type II toxin-antitoxin system RelE/ParE family toxin n=1 Tax=Paraburkholderia bannensis TaxID=765414 RepID=UPI000486D0A2|nr:type II toxin-antitoxin system RelE/ParE family toxin [Paraburkholderia bannensis]
MWTVTYYSERVKKEVFSLPVGIRADYFRLLNILEMFGADLRMPHSRAMGGGLFELRPRGREGIGRVFYCTQLGHRIVVLHSFVKKTQETPDAELRIGRKRLKEVLDNG